MRRSPPSPARLLCCQWRIGYSSMLAWALGLAPFKDNAWSVAVQVLR